MTEVIKTINEATAEESAQLGEPEIVFEILTNISSEDVTAMARFFEFVKSVCFKSATSDKSLFKAKMIEDSECYCLRLNFYNQIEGATVLGKMLMYKEMPPPALQKFDGLIYTLDVIKIDNLQDCFKLITEEQSTQLDILREAQLLISVQISRQNQFNQMILNILEQNGMSTVLKSELPPTH